MVQTVHLARKLALFGRWTACACSGRMLFVSLIRNLFSNFCVEYVYIGMTIAMKDLWLKHSRNGMAQPQRYQATLEMLSKCK